MFTVQIVGVYGAEAELVVPSAVVALDLALRADAAGFVWSATGRGHGRSLSLTALQELAEETALLEPGQASYLAHVRRNAALAAAARLS